MIERIIIGVVVAILDALVKRADVKASAKAEVYREALEKARAAKTFARDARAHPGGRTDLRVRDGADPIALRSDSSDSSGSAP